MMLEVLYWSLERRKAGVALPVGLHVIYGVCLRCAALMICIDYEGSASKQYARDQHTAFALHLLCAMESSSCKMNMSFKACTTA